MAQTVGDGGSYGTITLPRKPSVKKPPKVTATTQKERRDKKAAAQAADAANKQAAAQAKREAQAAKLRAQMAADAAAKQQVQNVGGVEVDKFRAPAVERIRAETYQRIQEAVKRSNVGITRPITQAVRDNFRDFKDPFSGLTPEQAHREKNKYLLDAAKTGKDQVALLNHIRRDQKQRGDATYNADLLTQADDKFGRTAADINKRLGEFMQERDYLEAHIDKKWAQEKLLEMSKSQRFKDLYADYAEMYGLGPGETGLFTKYYRSREEVRVANEDYWLGQLGRAVYGTPTTATDMRRRYSGLDYNEIAAKLEAEYEKKLTLQRWVEQEGLRIYQFKDDAERRQWSDVSPFVEKAVEVVSGQTGHGSLAAGGLNLNDPINQQRVLDAATAAWTDEWRRLNGPVPVELLGFGQAAYDSNSQAFLTQRTHFQDRVMQFFTGNPGAKAPSAIERTLGSFLTVPGVGPALELIGLPIGLVGLPFRTIADVGGVELTGPQLNLDAILGSNPDKKQLIEGAPGRSIFDVSSEIVRLLMGDQSVAPSLAGTTGVQLGSAFGVDGGPEARQRVADSKSEFADLVREQLKRVDLNSLEGIVGSIDPLWKIGAATSARGQEPLSPVHGSAGNLTFQLAADPLNFFGLGVFSDAAKLARARKLAEAAFAGAKPGARATGAEWLRILGDYHFGFRPRGGVGDYLRDFTELRPLKDVLGREIFSAADINPNTDLEAIIRSIWMKHSKDPNLNGFRHDVERFFKGTKIEPKQVQASIENLIEAGLIDRGARAIKNGELEDIIRVADSAVENAGRRADSLADDAKDAAVRNPQRQKAITTRKVRNAAQHSDAGAFERSPDFVSPPPAGVIVKNNPLRHGDFRAPRPATLKGGLFTRKFGRKQVAGSYRLTVSSAPHHAADIIAIAEDIARRHHITLRWARNERSLADNSNQLVELFGGTDSTMVAAGRELDEALRANRLGMLPPPSSRRIGKAGYTLDPADAAEAARLSRGEVIRPDPFRRLDRIERYAGSVDQRLADLTDQIKVAKEKLDKALARKDKGARDAGDAAHELRDLTDQYKSLQRTREGLAKHKRSLTSSDGLSRGVSRTERARLDFLGSELRRDEQFLRIERNRILNELRTATGPRATALRSRLEEIDDAITGVKLAAEDQLGQAHMAKVVGQRFKGDAKKYIKGQRIAPVHEGTDSLRIIQGQDMWQDYSRKAVVPDPDGPLETAIRDIGDGMKSIPAPRQAYAGILSKETDGLLKGLNGFNQIATLRVLRHSDDAQRALEDLADWLRRELDANPDYQAGLAAQQAKKTANLTDDELLDALLASRRVKKMNYDDYAAANRAVTAAIQKVRGWRARGALKGPIPDRIKDLFDEEAAMDLAMRRPNIMTDYDVDVAVAKIRTLNDMGLDALSYDEIHGVFRKHFVREQRARAIESEARDIAAKTGQPYKEAFKELRDGKWAEWEAENQLRRFVLGSDSGLRPDDYWREFQDAMSAEDLNQLPTPNMTELQERSLREGIKQKLGIQGPENTQQLQAALRGLGKVPDDVGEKLELVPIGEYPGVPGWMPVWRSSEPLYYEGSPVYGYFRKNMGMIIGPEHGPGVESRAFTAAHEYAHAMVDYGAREGFPEVGEGLAIVMGKDSDYWNQLFHLDARGYTPEQVANEAIAELYASWSWNQSLKAAGVKGADRMPSMSWEWIGTRLPAGMKDDFNRLGHLFEKFQAPAPEYFGLNLDIAPPFTNRAQAREWLVDNGFWSPATAEDIAAGRKVWSLDAEQDFWRGRFGDVPWWARDETFEGEILHQRYLYEQELQRAGYMDLNLEANAARGQIEDIKGATAYGDEATGIKRARSISEMRQWFIDRYGSRVVNDRGELIAAPWLMDPLSDEFMNYIGKRAADNLPFDRTLMKPGEVEAFSKAAQNSVRKFFERLEKAGDIRDIDFLSQEINRITLDIVDELMDNPVWRGRFLQGKNPLAAGLDYFGTFQRINVISQVAFPILNLAESLPVVGPRSWLLRLAERGLSRTVRREIHDAVPDLASLGVGKSTTLWEIGNRTAFEKLRKADGVFGKLREVPGTVAESPFALSKLGEDRLKLDFGRRIYQDRLDHFLAQGVDPRVAELTSRFVAGEKIRHFFPTLEDAPYWMHALNQVFPFVSYNFNVVKLYGGLLVEHPQYLRMFRVLGDFWADAQRQAWEDDHPGLPFPNDRQAYQFKFSVGGQEYTMDFAGLSDVTRGWSKVALLADGRERSLGDYIDDVLRVPHPWQRSLMAAILGTEDPYDHSTGGHSFIWPADLVDYINGLINDDGEFSFGDFVSVVLKVTTYSEPRPLDIYESLNAAYFALPKDQRPDFLEAMKEKGYDLVEHWEASNPEPWKYILKDQREPNWYDIHDSDQDAAERAEATKGYRELREYYDNRTDDLLRSGLSPDSQAYKDLRTERRVALLDYKLKHPVLISTAAFYMSDEDWQKQLDTWNVDHLTDQYFGLDDHKPQRGDYKSDAAFDAATDAFYDMKDAFLKNNPAVAERLRLEGDPVRDAIQAQRDHLFEVQDRIFARDRQIAAAEAKGDYGLAQALRVSQTLDALDIDRPTEVDYYPPVVDRPGNYILGPAASSDQRLNDYSKSRLPVGLVLPGATDRRFLHADPQKQHEMLVNYAYATSMKAIWDSIDNAENPGAAFVEAINNDPWLKRQYFARNPGKMEQYTQNAVYMNLIDHAVKTDNWKPFWKQIAADPEMARRWLFGSGYGFDPNKPRNPAIEAKLERLMERVQKTGNTDLIWKAIENDKELREAYFAGGKERKANWLENQRYQKTMGDLVRRSKATGDWSIFWDALEKNKWLREHYFKNHPGARAKWKQNAWYMGQMGSIMKRVKKTGDWDIFWNAIDNNKKLREIWFSHKAGRKQEYYNNKRYLSWIGDLVTRAKKSGNWQIFWDGLDANPEMAKIYYKSHPDAKANNAQNKAYIKAMGGWVKLLDAKKYDEAQRYFDALPAWMKKRYEKGHPQSPKDLKYAAAMQKWVSFFEKGDREGGYRYFDSLPQWIQDRYYAAHPEKKQNLAQSSAYSAAMAKWVGLLQGGDSQGARDFFNSLPDWIKEKYWGNHPENRDFSANHDMFAKLQEMYLLQIDQQADYLAANPDLQAWIKKVSGGTEEVRRAMILSVYRNLPKDAWLRRVYQQRYPEVFSDQAKAERQHAKTMRSLEQRPELQPVYEKYIDQIIQTYLGSVQGYGKMPKQLTKVQRDAWEATRRKRLKGRRQWALVEPGHAVPGMANVQELLQMRA